MPIFRLAAVAMLTALAGPVAVAQLPPSLAGRWELVATPVSDPNDRPAQTLIIREVLASTPAAIALAPAVRALVVERQTGGETTSTTIQIGMRGGTTSGIPFGSSGGSPAETLSQWETRWADGHLIVWSLDRTTAAGRVVEFETTEDWSIDTAGHLVIATLARETGRDPVHTLLSYRRQ